MDSARPELSVDVSGLSGSAADVIEVLARLQLAARRCGGTIYLRDADPALLALIELLGFAELLSADERLLAPGDQPNRPKSDGSRNACRLVILP